MKDIAVANRYANALYEEAKAENSVDAVASDLAGLQDLFKTNKDFATLVTTEALTTGEKLGVVESIGKTGKLNKLVYAFLVVLTRNDRLSILEEVIEAVNKRIREEKGEVQVQVTYAVPVDDAVRTDLVAQLTKITNKKVILNEDVDPSLLGGMKVLVGSTLYDMSVKGRLDALKNQLSR